MTQATSANTNFADQLSKMLQKHAKPKENESNKADLFDLKPISEVVS